MNNHYYFSVKRKRPEEIFNRVSDYYNKENITQYAKSKSIMRIQEKITKRALEILNLKKRRVLILDAGCGPGFTAMYLKEIGYKTVALDLILEFLKFYKINELNPIASDMCYLPFKPEIFDAIISISALQWIFRDIHDKNMENSLISLAKSFFLALKPNSKIIFQFYPKNDRVMEKIGKIFTNSINFDGNFIIDNPKQPRKRKIFLLLEKAI